MAVDQGTGPNVVTPLAKATAAAPSYTEGIVSPLSQDLAGGLRVNATIGSVSVSSDATATAAAPSYTEGTANPLSQNLTGDLRTIAKIASAQTLATVTTVGTVTTVAAVTAITNALPTGTNAIGKVNINAGAAALTSAAVTFASSGDNTVVAAVSAKTTKVYRLMIVVAGATSIIFKDGAGTSLTGAMPIAANGSITLDFDGEPWFTGSTNTAFIINSSNAVQVSGIIYYINS
jgi:hypothetical protein